MKRTLTPKQERFVAEYLVDLSATHAAMRAGYAAKTAYSQGQRLLKHVEVHTAIHAAMEARAQRTTLTADRVLTELARLAYVDIRQFYAADGSLKPLHTLPADLAAAVASVEVVQEGGEGAGPAVTRWKVRLWDKPKALDLLGKHFRLFVERRELTGKDGGPIAVHDLDAAQRLARLEELLAKRGS